MWVVPDDVTDAWIGSDAPTDQDQIELWIGKAEREVRFRVPDLMARLDAEAALVPPVTDLLEATKDVVVAMVTRVFRNPEGVRTRNETTGPFSGSITYGGDTPGGLYLTESELAKLTEDVASGGAYTVDMIPATSPFSPHYTPPAYPYWPFL